MIDETFRKHTATVSNIGGEVFISLPDDQYIKLTPEQARQIGGRLFIHAAQALGQERPEVIVLR
jgi:hypothetical protein